jgi:lysozyme family protein
MPGGSPGFQDPNYLGTSADRLLLQYITNSANNTIPAKYFNGSGIAGFGEKKPSIVPAITSIGTIPNTNCAA